MEKILNKWENKLTRLYRESSYYKGTGQQGLANDVDVEIKLVKDFIADLEEIILTEDKELRKLWEYIKNDKKSFNFTVYGKLRNKILPLLKTK